MATGGPKLALKKQVWGPSSMPNIVLRRCLLEGSRKRLLDRVPQGRKTTATPMEGRAPNSSGASDQRSHKAGRLRLQSLDMRDDTPFYPLLTFRHHSTAYFLLLVVGKRRTAHLLKWGKNADQSGSPKPRGTTGTGIDPTEVLISARGSCLISRA